jgi:TrmH family RNA methyltransferase
MTDTISSSGTGRVGQVKEITSLSNPVIKDIRALSMKKHRDETGTFLAEGLKLVIDAIDQGWNLRTLIYAKAQRGKPQVEKIAALTVARGGLVLEVSEKVLTAITRRDNPQAVIAVFEQKLTHSTPSRRNPTKHGSRSTGCVIRAIWAPSFAPQTRRCFRRYPDRRHGRSVLDRDRPRHHGINLRRAADSRLGSRIPRLVEKGLAAGGRQPSQGQRRLPVDSTTRAMPVVLLMGNEQAGLPDTLARAAASWPGSRKWAGRIRSIWRSPQG